MVEIAKSRGTGVESGKTNHGVPKVNGSCAVARSRAVTGNLGSEMDRARSRDGVPSRGPGLAGAKKAVAKS